jgi:adenylate cyclase
MNKRKILVIFILSGFVCCIISLFYLTGSLTRFENIAYDSLVKLMRSQKPSAKEITLLLIDETSLEALNPIVGRWPWPRAIYSDILEFLSLGEPRAVLFDILFTENQKDNLYRGISADDMQFVKATQEKGFVYHAMHIRVDDEDEFNLNLLDRPLPAGFVERFSLKDISARTGRLHENNIYYIPFKELYEASYGMGIVEFSPDHDGVFRRTIPVREYSGKFFPVMGIAPFVQQRPITITQARISIGNRHIPLDSNGNYILNFYGEFDTYSMSGILASLQRIKRGDIEDLIINPMEFKDKIVFVGASASGVEDLKHTPISPRTPGVFLHATLASNFLMNDFLIPPHPGKTLCMIMLMTLLCTAGIILMKRYALKISIPLLLCFFWIAFTLFQFRCHILNDFVPPLTSVFFSTMTSFGFLLLTEGREKFQLRKLFSQYVSSDLLIEVLKNNHIASLSMGKKGDITVIFADIRNFTSYSDRTPPEKVVEMLNFFFSHMTQIILSNNGTIDKFIGDAIMAYWGTPLEIKNHPEQAVIAAISMINAMESLKEEFRERGFDLDPKIGIGINSGHAILGNIGSEDRLNYTVVGDTVNVASRLQELTKFYECPIIISESTCNRIKQDIPCRLIDAIRLRGKKKYLRIYEPLYPKDRKDMKIKRQLCTITNLAFDLYQKKNFRGAFEAYSMIEDGKLKTIFVTRCRKRLRRLDN